VEKEVSGMREVGGLVGGRVVGRLEGGGRRFPKKIGVRGGAKKNIIKKKLSPEEKNIKGPKKKPGRKNDADQVGDSFIPSMKSQNGIFWMVHCWGAGVTQAVKKEKVWNDNFDNVFIIPEPEFAKYYTWSVAFAFLYGVQVSGYLFQFSLKVHSFTVFFFFLVKCFYKIYFLVLFHLSELFA
jgi:hypothetical protein